MNYKDKDGCTALMLAAINGHAHVVRFLVGKSFIDVNAKTVLRTQH